MTLKGFISHREIREAMAWGITFKYVCVKYILSPGRKVQKVIQAELDIWVTDDVSVQGNGKSMQKKGLVEVWKSLF